MSLFLTAQSSLKVTDWLLSTAFETQLYGPMLIFGYGKHSCPGRFFASNEIKVIVIHMLLKYDWEFTDQGRLPNGLSGTDRYMDPRQKVMLKSRKEEIKLGLP